MAMEEGGEDLLAVEATATPLGRICEPGEVAALIHFLAAPDCAFITGQWINICGGLTAGLSDKLWQTLLDKQ
jgi:NAD(P)-dependent dehydrogenase (short-subunit alcohol dehydrogenase family)